MKLIIRHNAKALTIGLDVHIPKQNWNETTATVTGLPNRQALNSYLTRVRLNAENKVMDLSLEGKLAKMDVHQLRDILLGKEERRKNDKEFASTYQRFMNQKEKRGTRSVYRQTWVKLQAFCQDLEALRYEDITRGWLMDFDAFLARTCKSRNARNIHLRNIRAVFNFAIDEEYTTLYPFRRFKIRTEETRKRCLSVEQLRSLMTYPCEAHQEKYRDMFVLMFFLLGVNPADLFQAKKSDVVCGRLEYRRAKTGKLYSVFIEPEAQAIIEKYAGEGEYLLDVSDRYGNYADFLHRMNRELKKIGPMKRKGRGGKKFIEPAFPDLSAYWSRHTWATIAYSIDVPKETISEALGHEMGSRVTSIYIMFDRRKVDKANRRVLDYVLYGKL